MERLKVLVCYEMPLHWSRPSMHHSSLQRQLPRWAVWWSHKLGIAGYRISEVINAEGCCNSVVLAWGRITPSTVANCWEKCWEAWRHGRRDELNSVFKTRREGCAWWTRYWFTGRRRSFLDRGRWGNSGHAASRWREYRSFCEKWEDNWRTWISHIGRDSEGNGWWYMRSGTKFEWWYHNWAKRWKILMKRWLGQNKADGELLHLLRLINIKQ